MPPIENPLDNLPLQKVDASPAVQELSKTPTGATKVLLGLWTVMLLICSIGVVVYAASNGNIQRDKDDINCQAKMSSLQHQYDSVCGNLSRLVDYNHEQDKTIIQLRDSLKMQQLLKHYHITEGKQTIILTPKNIQQ